MTLSGQPLVSVVLPVYNRAAVVRRAIDSVLGQSFADFELIVVDDGSTDESASVLAQVEDYRVRMIAHDHNLGGAAARNSGVRLAKGDYIAFQDSDDVWDYDKLERQMRLFSEQPEDVGVVYSAFRRHRGSHVEVIPDAPPDPDGRVHAAVLVGNFITIQASVIRAECFENCGLFDERLPRFQDWELFIRLSKHYRFGFLDAPLVDVYFSEKSISADDRALTTAMELILSKHRDDFERVDRRIYARHLHELGHRLCLQGDCRKGRDFMARAAAIAPSAKGMLQLRLTHFGSGFYRGATRFYNRRIGSAER